MCRQKPHGPPLPATLPFPPH
ncbi:unnamed protein product [Spirodela intermedia]|uniref:Uncharacterized protein n=1 Tax=Spirodela intermedia TaxID=51605 RepID=A0A7I8INP4_SPIIN|nr:unnamed protein product [Spirodela intermedia]CAA6659429.1 unnamed protein product [Spirodela intermedia]